MTVPALFQELAEAHRSIRGTAIKADGHNLLNPGNVISWRPIWTLFFSFNNCWEFLFLFKKEILAQQLKEKVFRTSSGYHSMAIGSAHKRSSEDDEPKNTSWDKERPTFPFWFHPLWKMKSKERKRLLGRSLKMWPFRYEEPLLKKKRTKRSSAISFLFFVADRWSFS